MQGDVRPAATRLARLLAALLVCATGLAPALHAEGRDDRLCVPAPAGAGATVLDAGAEAGPQHCDVCHWLRSLRALDAADADLATAWAAAAAPDPAEPHRGTPPYAPSRASRAPPRS